MFFIVLLGMVFLLEYYIKKHMDKVRTLQEQRQLAGGKLVLKKYYNIGAAGNFFKNHPKGVRVMHALALFLVVAELLRVLPKENKMAAKIGLSFLAGGGLSNLYDRLKRGYVVDYVSFGFGPKWFRKLVFNCADFFVFIGIFLYIIQFIKKEGDE